MNHAILDRPIAFHRSFVALTGSVTAALMLSQAVYWQQRCQSEDDYWWKTQADWTEETGMSRKEQESARRKLAKLGFWEEGLRGVPAKMYYRVDLDALMAALDKLDSPKGASQYARKGQTGMPESGNHYKEAETTSETTDKTTKEKNVPSERASPEKKPANQEPTETDLLIWTELLSRLIETGVKDKDARGLIGKWRKEVGDKPLAELVVASREVAPSEPVAWFTKAIQARKAPARQERRPRSEFDIDMRELDKAGPPPGWA